MSFVRWHPLHRKKNTQSWAHESNFYQLHLLLIYNGRGARKGETIVHNFFLYILIERVLKYLPSPYVSVFWGTLFIYKTGAYRQGVHYPTLRRVDYPERCIANALRRTYRFDPRTYFTNFDPWIIHRIKSYPLFVCIFGFLSEQTSKKVMDLYTHLNWMGETKMLILHKIESCF